MDRKINIDENGTPLEITDQQALVRGVEIASDEEFDALIGALTEMREQTSYSGQDYDRSSKMLAVKRKIERIGKMPIKRRTAA